MISKSYLQVSIFCLILLFAIFIRTVNINSNPAGIFVDEASHGMEARSILKTGTDTHGVRFPIFFEAIQDYKDPVFIYSLVPMVAVIGTSIDAVRMLSAIYGVAAVIMMYLFLIESTSDKKLALIGALILSILPWHVHFSRIGFQLISTVFWYIFTFWAFEKSIKNSKWMPLFFGGLVITFFTYSVAKMYIVPLVIILFLFHLQTAEKWLKNHTFWISGIISIIITIGLIVPYVLDGTFFHRWMQVQATAPHGFTLLGTYIAHFSPMYLFIGGDAGFPGQYLTRHSLFGLGELFWFQMPFILIGSIVPFFSKPFKSLRFIVPLLLLYPLGSMFSHELPQATRSSFGIIPFTVLTAVGISYLLNYCSSPKARFLYLFIFSGIILISVIELTRAVYDYPLKSSGYWGFQMGMKETLQLFKSEEKQYDHLYVTHRFNRTQELMDFINIDIGCRKCLIISNPIKLPDKDKELYSLRMEDIQEAYSRYPKARYHIKHTIKQPNGIDELYVGTFTQI